MMERKEIKPGVWEYLDEQENCFAFEVWQMTGIELYNIDAFMESDQKIINRDDMLELRHDALNSYNRNQFELAISNIKHLHSLCTLGEVIPKARLGHGHQKNQKKKAQKPRNEFIHEIVAGLVNTNEDYTAKELWPLLFSSLEGANASPQEIEHPSDIRKCKYEYTLPNGRDRKITFSRFQGLLKELES